MTTARVVLKGARTYSLGGRRWIQDVPQIVHGEDEVKSFKENGYFHVTMLKKDAVKAAEKKASEADDEDDDLESNASKSSKLKPKAGLKKRH